MRDDGLGSMDASYEPTLGAEMDVQQAIRERRTIGQFSDQPVTREQIEQLLEAAVWAPNHRNTEPWRFHVVAGAAREEMAEAIAATVDEGRARAARSKLTRSPVFIVVSQVRHEQDPVLDLEDYAACSCATQNLLLAAHAEGLAAKWSTGKLAHYAAAKEYLGLEPIDRIVAYVYLGQAAVDGAPEAERREPNVEWRGL